MTHYERTKRWRLRNREARSAQVVRYYRKSQGGPRNRAEWTSEEMELIIADDRPSDTQLAAELGRSVKAIQMKRHRITR